MMMDYVKAVFSKYAEFAGRARRSEYWYFALFNFLVAVGLSLLGLVSDLFSIPYYLYSLAAFIPGLAVAVRRMHDIGKSGWWLLIAFIPLIGAIVLLVWMATEGNAGVNQYGDDPKNPSVDMSDPIHHLV